MSISIKTNHIFFHTFFDNIKQNRKEKVLMKLDQIKKEPVKIVSYLVLTLLFTYLITGGIMPALATTCLCAWICMMPRLHYEDSTYKEKLPQFLIKGDFINKLVSIIIPVILAVIYMISFSASNSIFQSPIQNMLIIATPILLSVIHYIIVKKSENVYDWITPLITSFLTVIGVEFISGNLGQMFANLSPQTANISYFWAFIMEVFFVYGVFRVLSIILAARTLAMGVTSFLFIGFAVLNGIMVSQLGTTFKVAEIIDFKHTIAMMKILIENKLDTTMIAMAVGTLAIIVLIAYLLSKKSTLYNLVKRAKSCICGVAILLIVIFGSSLLTQNATIYNPELNYGYIYSTMTNIGAKNTYSENFEKMIQEEEDKIFKKDETSQSSQSDTTSSQETSSTGTSSTQSVN